MTTHSCSCKSNPAASGVALERPRYYPRQLVTPEILNLGQDYLRNKQRLHNRMLHGWGVACGLWVCAAPTSDNKAFEPWKILVKPGYALSPYGDGILVEKPHIVDLRESPNCVDPCATTSEDPWCADTYVPRDQGVYYLAIKFAEAAVRPERAQPSGCGCGSQNCEDSRWRDGYEFGVLCECPLGSATPPAADLDALLKCDQLDCPPCVTSPWVGLATIEVAADGTILVVNNCDCRRLVISFANFWWKCDCPPIKISTTTKDAVVVTRDGATFDVVVKAQNVDPKATVRVTRDVTAKVKSFDAAKGLLTITVAADPKAIAGPRTIVVMNPDSTMATLTGAIEVAPAAGVVAPRPKRIVTPRR